MAFTLKEFIKEPKIAYFSMEIGLRSDVPTYSGGLGVLAGDTIKSAADLNLPLVAITLISRKGYFRQRLLHDGTQVEEPCGWNPENILTPISQRVSVWIEGREVRIGAWVYVVESLTGGKVPVFFLDTDLPENNPQDREITDYLYGGDASYRFKQEIVLGIGGVRMLDELGFTIKKYHMNEGHSSLLTLELLRKFKRDIEEVWDERLVWNDEMVKEICVFTTHTPVEAGHDKFPYEIVKRILEPILPLHVLKRFGGEDVLNMTRLGFNLSKYINGVAKRHGEVSKKMFPGYHIHAITNGVHSYTWTCEPIKRLLDKYIPGWANEPELLVRVTRIPHDELWNAHMEAKKELIDYIRDMTGESLDPHILTIGFARRATAYKRPSLIFYDVERLRGIGRERLQLVFAGKAHPKDEPGKMAIKRIFEIKEILKDDVKIIFLENYNMEMALKIISGVDIWLNTPLRPLEASGTSGMKAAHNGVINFSVLDGWWIEGCIEDYTGWSIGTYPSESPQVDPDADKKDADDLYSKLEHVIIPTFYEKKNIWHNMMANSIGKVAYYFNSHRMMRRYVTEAYIK